MATKEAIKNIKEQAVQDHKARTEDLYSKNAILKEKIVNMEAKVEALNDVVCKECKQIEASNVDILNKMQNMEVTLNEQEKLIDRIKIRMGL